MLIYINFIKTINYYKNNQCKKLQFHILQLNIGGIYRKISEGLSKYYKKNVQNKILFMRDNLLLNNNDKIFNIYCLSKFYN